jgi:hypothetical protein
MKKLYFVWFVLMLIISTANAGTYTVTNTADTGPGSLRQAIADANFNAGVLDDIVFSIPGGGPHVITLGSGSPLPAISDPVFINGYSEPGAYQATSTYPANILVVLNFSGNQGLVFTHTTGTSAVSGLSLVHATGSGNAGIYLNNSLVTVTGNFIGLYPDGTDGGNQMGIRVTGIDNAVIGGNDAERNVISFNITDGILLENDANYTIISGNYIGTDPAGIADFGNVSDGIHVDACDQTSILNNIISGNNGNGINLTK